MEFEPWWLLALPLFFGLGWWASRLERRPPLQEHAQAGSAARRSATPHDQDGPTRALLALLQETPDRAIEILTRQIQQEPDSVALQSALALLYRNRGETDRAIRVHQALADRSDLSQEQRAHARLELGLDFLKAGLIDRAEDTLTLLEGSAHAAQALRHRVAIAQKVKDWPRALRLLGQLTLHMPASPGTPGATDPLALQRMHLHCELAHASEDAQQARQAIDAALQACSDHPRPWLLMGQWSWSQQDANAAVDAWSRMLALSPEHAALLGPEWQDAWTALGQTAEGVHRLNEAQGRQPKPLPLYRCTACGFKARRHYWQCPGCTTWDSIPARGEMPVGLPN